LRSAHLQISKMSVRERFDRHLPEYGTLWRALAAASRSKAAADSVDGTNSNAATAPVQAESSGDNANGGSDAADDYSTATDDGSTVADDSSGRTETVPVDVQSPMTQDADERQQQNSLGAEVPSLLPAILGGKAVSLRVPTTTHAGCDVVGCEGDCAEPIFEEEEAELDDVVRTKDAAAASAAAVDASSTDRSRRYHDHFSSDSLSEDGSAFNIDLSFLHTREEAKPKADPSIDEDNDASSIASNSNDESDSTVVVMDMSHLLVEGSNTPKGNAEFSSRSRNEEEGEEGDDFEESSSDDSTVVKIDLSHLVETQSNPKRSGVDRSPLSSSVCSSDPESICTSEEEWVEGDTKSHGDTNKISATSPKGQAAKEDSFEVIILSDDDDTDDGDDSAGENDSEYADDSFVEEVSISSSSESQDRMVVGKPVRKEKPGKRKQAETKTDKQTRQVLVSRSSFSKNRQHYTTSTFVEFNTKAFNSALSSVEVSWSKRLKTTAGLTRLKRIGTTDNMRRIATIELSTKCLDSVERLRSTLLHEMCHAAAWLVDGVHKPPHGSVFKKWASLSMRKIRDVEVTTTHDYVIQFKYAWKCTNNVCGTIIKRHSRSVDPKRHCCGSCKGKLIEIEVPGSKKDVSTIGHTPKKKRAPTGFSLFVQQNSKSVRARLVAERGSSVTQPEVMKECGRIWREQKEAKKNGESKKPASKTHTTASVQDENVPDDLNKAIGNMENRLKLLSM